MRHNNRLHKILIFVLIAALLITGCGKIPEKGETVSTTPPPSASEVETSATTMPKEENKVDFFCLPGITPGVTTREEAIGLMGEPESIENLDDGSEILYYPSDVKIIPNTVILREGVVIRTGALSQDESVTLTSLKEKYGEPEQIAYSYFAQGTYTYLYPQKGFMFVAEPESGEVSWMDCFVPMSMMDFLAGIGSSLPTDNPYSR